MLRLSFDDKMAWDVLIGRDKRNHCAYTIDVLQELMGEDAFREIYIKQAEEFTSLGAFVSSQIEGKEHSFVVTHTLS